MRRLITHLERARDHHRDNSEHGAVAIIVALSLVVLLGFVALAVDAGAMYEERAELQNAADSAALAVAQQCAAGGECDPNSAETKDLAKKYAEANMRDGSVKVQSLKIEGPKVKVHVITEEGEDNNNLSLTFAPIIGVDDVTVGARATAGWQYPVGGPAPLPIIFSKCEFKLNTGPQLLELGGTAKTKNASTTGSELTVSSGLYTPAEAADTTADLPTIDKAQIVPASVVVPAGVPMVPAGEGPSPSPTPTETVPPTVTEGCEDYVSESGLVLPGGFGAIDPDLGSDANGCTATVENGQEVGSDTGKSLPNACQKVLEASIGKVVLLPIYDDYGKQGTNGWYKVSGWASFKITGYHFPGNGMASNNTGAQGAPSCTKTCAGLIGEFVKFGSISPDYTYDPSAPNYGAAIVTLQD